MTDKMTEEKAAAVLMANLKGSRQKPAGLLEMARATRLLITAWGLPRMSNFFDVSEFQLRQIDKINELPAEVKALVKKGKLGIDGSYQLWRLNGDSRQVEAANAAVGMSEAEIRALVKVLQADSTLRPDEERKKVVEANRKKINLVILPLTDKTYKSLVEIAKAERVNPHDLVLRLVEEYVRAK